MSLAVAARRSLRVRWQALTPLEACKRPSWRSVVSTPLWRERQEAASRTSAALFAKQFDRRDCRPDWDPSGSGSRLPRGAAAVSRLSPEAKAHLASAQLGVLWFRRKLHPSLPLPETAPRLAALADLCARSRPPFRHAGWPRRNKISQALLWALKDLPPNPDVRAAVNTRRGPHDRTLLHSLSSAGFCRAVHLLLDTGLADVLAKDNQGFTALHAAAQTNRPQVAQALLTRSRGGVHVRDRFSRTPMHIAGKKGHIEVIQVLASHGAALGAQDSDGKTPLSYEEPSRYEEIRTGIKHRNCAQRKVGQVEYVKQFGKMLPHHIQAPKLVMTRVGYCPVDDDGNVIQLERGILQRRRQGPSTTGRGPINWYSFGKK